MLPLVAFKASGRGGCYLRVCSCCKEIEDGTKPGGCYLPYFGNMTDIPVLVYVVLQFYWMYPKRLVCSVDTKTE